MTTHELINSHIAAVSDLKAGYTLGHADVAILQSVARALLAANEQEPVFFVEIEGDDWINAGRIEGGNRPDLGLLPDGINNLYAHPASSIPVAVPDYYVVVTTANVWQTFCKTRAEADFIVSKPFNKGYYVLEVYTRRAALLKGDKS